ncbi:hypothetical protein C814_01800 [Anaerotruncus sp. G3(2012)]|nr:hypothetical protein C814_01800 [Anaerotruncus sp. G3(2012)]
MYFFQNPFRDVCSGAAAAKSLGTVVVRRCNLLENPLHGLVRGQRLVQTGFREKPIQSCSFHQSRISCAPNASFWGLV